MTHDLAQGKRVCRIQGPPGTGKTMTNLFMSMLHTLIQKLCPGEYSITFGTLSNQNAPLLAAVRAAWKLAEGEQTEHIGEVARVKAYSNKESTPVDATDKEAGKKKVVFSTEGKYEQSNVKSLRYEHATATSDESQMTPGRAATAVGNVQGHMMFHTEVGDTHQCHGAHQSIITQEIAAAFLETQGSMCCPAVQYLPLQRLITVLEEEYSKALRNIKSGADSRAKKEAAEEIQQSWHRTGEEDLQDAITNKYCNTTCPEEKDQKQYIPRSRTAQMTQHLGRREKTELIEKEKKRSRRHGRNIIGS